VLPPLHLRGPAASAPESGGDGKSGVGGGSSSRRRRSRRPRFGKAVVGRNVVGCLSSFFFSFFSFFSFSFFARALLVSPFRRFSFFG
jgi:hypothetical protein